MGAQFNKLNRQAQIFEVLTKMEERLPTTLEYMDHLKSLFFCTICGYGNQQFIDIPRKTVNFNADSCDSLVRNTFQFSYLMNNLLLPFIMDVSEFIVKSMKDKKHKILKLKPLGIIMKAVDDCAKDYRDNDENLNNCLAYCSFFKLNRNTPEIEGYPELFTNFLVQVDAFVKSGGTIKEKVAPAKKPDTKKKATKKPKKKDEPKKGKKRLRILEELLAGIELPGIKYRLLAEKQASDAKKGGPIVEFVDEFDPLVIMKKLQEGDIYDKDGVDPNFDDAAMAQALELQAILDQDKVDGLGSIIRAQYAKNFEPELDDIDSDDIFSRPADEKVHLDIFKSKFGFAGIDFRHEMLKVDWNMNIHTLVASLKGKSETGPSNDHLDIKVMDLANKVSNADVMKFHRDNFISFDGVHLHQPNKIMKELYLSMNDKLNQEYVKTTQRASNLIHNVEGEEAATKFKKTLKTQEENFAMKVERAMSRVRNRIKNAQR